MSHLLLHVASPERAQLTGCNIKARSSQAVSHLPLAIMHRCIRFTAELSNVSGADCNA